MRLSFLIESYQLMEATKCGIYNTLKKFRPDLTDEMNQIEGQDVSSSIQFLIDYELWDDHAEGLKDNFLRWLNERGHAEQNQDEVSANIAKWQEELMCHVAKLIRNSARG